MNIKNIVSCARCLTDKAPRRADVIVNRNWIEFSAFNSDIKPKLSAYNVVNVVDRKDDKVTKGSIRKIVRQLTGLSWEGAIKIKYTVPTKLIADSGNGWVFSYVKKYDPKSVSGNSAKKLHFEILCNASSIDAARFGICKELVHILTGTVDECGLKKNASIKEIVRRLNALLRSAMNWRDLIDKAARTPEEQARLLMDRLRDGVEAETACFYLAIETLIPWRLRNQFHELREKNRNRADCNQQVASAFCIPVQIVNHICDSYKGVVRDPYIGIVSHFINGTYDDERKRPDFSCWCPAQQTLCKNQAK